MDFGDAVAALAGGNVQDDLLKAKEKEVSLSHYFNQFLYCLSLLA